MSIHQWKPSGAEWDPGSTSYHSHYHYHQGYDKGHLHNHDHDGKPFTPSSKHLVEDKVHENHSHFGQEEEMLKQTTNTSKPSSHFDSHVHLHSHEYPTKTEHSHMHKHYDTESSYISMDNYDAHKKNMHLHNDDHQEHLPGYKTTGYGYNSSSQVSTQSPSDSWGRDFACTHSGTKKAFSKDNVVMHGGGTSHSVSLTGMDIVLDLTDSSFRKNQWTLPKEWKSSKMIPRIIDMYIPDMKTPESYITRDFWEALWLDLKTDASSLDRDLNVLVMCMGGHGRTGTILIILSLIAGVSTGDPLAWIRKEYCNKAVESKAQIEYIKSLFPEVKIASDASKEVSKSSSSSKPLLTVAEIFGKTPKAPDTTNLTVEDANDSPDLEFFISTGIMEVVDYNNGKPLTISVSFPDKNKEKTFQDFDIEDGLELPEGLKRGDYVRVDSYSDLSLMYSAPVAFSVEIVPLNELDIRDIGSFLVIEGTLDHVQSKKGSATRLTVDEDFYYTEKGFTVIDKDINNLAKLVGESIRLEVVPNQVSTIRRISLGELDTTEDTEDEEASYKDIELIEELSNTGKVVSADYSGGKLASICIDGVWYTVPSSAVFKVEGAEDDIIKVGKEVKFTAVTLLNKVTKVETLFVIKIAAALEKSYQKADTDSSYPYGYWDY